MTARVRMPEAPVNEDRPTCRAVRDVRGARQRPDVQTISQSELTKNRPNDEFRLGVLLSDEREASSRRWVALESGLDLRAFVPERQAASRCFISLMWLVSLPRKPRGSRSELLRTR
jgi:hypothetical protein